MLAAVLCETCTPLNVPPSRSTCYRGVYRKSHCSVHVRTCFVNGRFTYGNASITTYVIIIIIIIIIIISYFDWGGGALA